MQINLPVKEKSHHKGLRAMFRKRECPSLDATGARELTLPAAGPSGSSLTLVKHASFPLPCNHHNARHAGTPDGILEHPQPQVSLDCLVKDGQGAPTSASDLVSLPAAQPSFQSRRLSRAHPAQLESVQPPCAALISDRPHGPLDADRRADDRPPRHRTR